MLTCGHDIDMTRDGAVDVRHLQSYRSMRNDALLSLFSRKGAVEVAFAIEQTSLMKKS